MTNTANTTDRDYFDALYADLALDFVELEGTTRFAKPFSYASSVTLIVQWLVAYRPDIETVRFRRSSKKTGRRVTILDNAGAPLSSAYEPADDVAAHLVRAWWDKLSKLGTDVEVSPKGKRCAFTISLDTLASAAGRLAGE